MIVLSQDGTKVLLVPEWRAPCILPSVEIPRWQQSRGESHCCAREVTGERKLLSLRISDTDPPTDGRCGIRYQAAEYLCDSKQSQDAKYVDADIDFVAGLID